MWYGTHSLGVVKNVLKLHNLLYMDREIEYTTVTITSGIASYVEEIHIAKCNRRGDVVMQCHHH